MGDLQLDYEISEGAGDYSGTCKGLRGVWKLVADTSNNSAEQLELSVAESPGGGINDGH